MIKNDLKLRQICLIYLAFMPVNKILMLPSMLASYAFEQLYIPLLINFGVDALVLFFFLKLSDRFPEQTLFYILTERFNSSVAKTVYFLYALFFFLKSLVPIIEQKYYVDSTLYEVFPNFLSFLPLLLLSCYACCKGLKVLGRTADLSIWFTILGFSIAFLFSLGTGDFSNLLPILQKPSIGVFKGTYATTMWFFESSYMFLFLGHFKEEAHKKRKILISFAVGATTIIVFTLLFYAIFARTAVLENFAVSDMTIYTTKIVNISRFDYLAIFMLLFSAIYAICLPIFCATKCIERTFEFKKATIPAVAINLILLVILLITKNKFHSFLAFAVKYLNWYFLGIGILLPLLLLIILKRRKNEKKQN